MAETDKERVEREASDKRHLEFVRKSLAALSPERLRGLIHLGFQRWCEHPDNADSTRCRLEDVMQNVEKELADASGVAPAPEWSSKVVSYNQFEEPYAEWVEQIWALIRAGLIIPFGHATMPYGEGYLRWVRVTRRGRQVFTQGDHPLSRDFISRMNARCPHLPVEVGECFQDAIDCMSKDLLRPAVVMAGVAFETALAAIGRRMGGKGHLNHGDFDKAKAAVRIDMVKNALGRVPGLANDPDVHAIRRALDYAHVLRERRNHGGHTAPRYPFNELSEVEDIIVHAGMQLPNLWLLHAKV